MAKRNDNKELTFGKVEVNAVIDTSSMNRVMIQARPIRCKACSFEFHSYDATNFDYSKERILIHCPKCSVQNLVLKERTL